MTIVPVLFAFDNSMMMPAGVCISSLLENSEPDTFYDIFILHNKNTCISNKILYGLPEKYKNCRITDRIADTVFDKSYKVRGITEATYYRLLAPKLIPEYNIIIYSDVDVIFREDLSKYYHTDIGEYYFGAVDNCSALRPKVRKHLSHLGLDYKKGYYYAGNLIINSKSLLEKGLINEFIQLGQQSFPQQDMDIINIACNGHFFSLGPSFCLTVQLYELMLEKRDEMNAIYGHEEITHALEFGTVHYNGAKPWNEACPNMDIWWSYYRKSIFYDELFARDFWRRQRDLLTNLPLKKRIKLLLRYPIDKHTDHSV